MTLLRVSNMRVSFGNKEVVKGIDFSIAPGEKLALVGESGSGKTVTALSLLGLLGNGRCSGTVSFNGASGTQDLFSLSEQAIRAIRGQEIAMIFQEPMTALNPLFSIGNQIAEVVQLKLGLKPAQAAKIAIELLEQTGMPEPARRANAFPHQLSGGQRQRAMIAMALACKPRLLLADEPTTALDVSVRAQILDLLQALQKETGMAVLMITHDLNLVRKFADRVAVMENGHLVESGSVAEVFANAQQPYTKKLIDSTPTRDPNEAAASTGPALLEAKNVKVDYPVQLPGWRGWFKKGSFTAVHHASFSIGTGRTLGVIGESGSGKSSLALAVLGLHPQGGKISFDGQGWGKDKLSDQKIRRSMQVVFQDPFSSLSPRMTVAEIVGEGLLVHHAELSPEQGQQRVLQTLAEVGLTEAQFPNLLARYPHEFSGGQRQRVAIARALIVDPRLLVLDEPTSALDVTIQKQVLSLLQGLQRTRGLSYLLITHDVAVIRAMAHDVLVMKDGQVVEMGSAKDVLDASQHPYTKTLIAAST